MPNSKSFHLKFREKFNKTTANIRNNGGYQERKSMEHQKFEELKIGGQFEINAFSCMKRQSRNESQRNNYAN